MTRKLAPLFAAALVATFMAAGCSLTLDPAKYEPKQAGDCAAGTKPCGYKCVPDNDPSTGCGNPSCAPCGGVLGANQQAACNPDLSCGAGCLPGFADCDTVPSNGCEASLTNNATCGSCYRSCDAAFPCLAPDLVCAPRIALLGIVGTVTGLSVSVDASIPPIRQACVAGTTLNGGSMEGFLAGVSPTGTAMNLLYTPGTLDPLYGLQFSGGAGYVLAVNPSASIPYLAEITTLSPTVVATVQSASGSGLPLGLAAYGTFVWWIHSAVQPVCYADGFTFECVSIGFPPRAPVAIAFAPWVLPPKAYVADVTGVISSFTAPLSAGVPGMTEVPSAGRVGAMVARQNGAATTELIWTELDTGDVRLWSTLDPAIQTIFKGSGPASSMHIATSNTLSIYWTNATTGDVMKYVPGIGATRIGRSPSPQFVAVDDFAFVYWSDADGSVRSTAW